MRIVVLARTRMYGSKVCIGGMSDAGDNFRLMTAECDYHNKDCPYQVGQIWEMTVRPCEKLEPPHLEDVAVVRAELIGNEDVVRAFVVARVGPWKGGIETIFDSKIRFTGSGSGYVSHAGGLPSASTGFWIPNKNLQFTNNPRPAYSPTGDGRYLSYVGTTEPIQVIPMDALVRVSLAKWWRPPGADSSLELRCYAQLSGWF